MDKEKLLSIIDEILSEYENNNNSIIDQEKIESIISDIHWFIDDMPEKKLNKIISKA